MTMFSHTLTRRISVAAFGIFTTFSWSVVATSVRAQRAKAADNQPPEGVTSARMMSAIRNGNVRSARSQGVSYLKLHPGTPRTGAHCHILVAFAYADVLLERNDEAKQALGVFDKGCNHTAVRNDYMAEVARVRRVLRGEPLNAVYTR